MSYVHQAPVLRGQWFTCCFVQDNFRYKSYKAITLKFSHIIYCLESYRSPMMREKRTGWLSYLMLNLNYFDFFPPLAGLVHIPYYESVGQVINLESCLKNH